MSSRHRRGFEAAKQELAGRSITVMGYGDHGGGAGMVDFLTAVGARVVLTENRARDSFPSEVLDRLAAAGVVTHFGGHDPSHLDGAHMLVRNPAVRFSHPLLATARERDIPVEMEMTLFLRWWPGRIVGITGTKGKSTTTTLCDAVLSVDRPTLKAGNLRISAIQALLPGTTDPEATAILELSSFQLEGTGERRQSPEVAVVTNLDEDHLDVYGDTGSYWAAKSSIWMHQSPDDWLVLPWDDAATRDYVERTLAEADCAGARRLYFGEVPLPEGRDGAWVSGGVISARWNGAEAPVVAVEELALRSNIAIVDLCAAICVALAEGEDISAIAVGCRAAREVQDRRELVAEIDGVSFVNDTTATAPRAATATVASFSEDHLVVICGGKDKGSAFGAFADELARSADHVVLLRHENYDASGLIERLLIERGAGDKVSWADSLAEAVSVSAGLIGPEGGVVLMSPAAASFGPFANEFDRGAQFRSLVKQRQP